MITSVLVALDGSATSNAGLRVALDLARDRDAALTGLHVIDDRGIVINLREGHLPAEYFHKLYAAMRKRGQSVLTKAEAVARRAGVPMTAVLADAGGKMVAQAILDQSRKMKPDLIVMGTHGRRGIARAIMGSDAEEVLRETNIPMLFVRSPRYPKRRNVALPLTGRRRPGMAVGATRP